MDITKIDKIEMIKVDISITELKNMLIEKKNFTKVATNLADNETFYIRC